MKIFNIVNSPENATPPSKYLGIEFGKMNRKNSFNLFLIEFNTNWQDGKLHTCLRGRLTLIKSTLTSIPNYSLACFKAASYICKQIDKIIIGFWWGHESGERKLHLKDWNSLCLAKSKRRNWNKEDRWNE